MHLIFKILRHKTLKDHLGIISNGFLISSNNATPQLYPSTTQFFDLENILLLPDQRKRLKADFELVSVTLVEGGSIAEVILNKG